MRLESSVPGLLCACAVEGYYLHPGFLEEAWGLQWKEQGHWSQAKVALTPAWTPLSWVTGKFHCLSETHFPSLQWGLSEGNDGS